jgi:hypothetical protein
VSLIVETGAIVTGANTFVTRVDFIAYALLKGIVIANTSATDAQLINAGIYINAQEPRLKGVRVERAQSMAFPRDGVIVDGFEWEDDEIPRNVVLAQMELALDLNAGIDIYNPPNSASAAVRRKRVDGAVEVEYAVSDEMKLSRNSTSMALMRSLMKNNGMTVVLERA